jgi:hypothetical protein
VDGIDTSGYAISAQRAPLNYRVQSGAEESHPLRHGHNGERSQARDGNEGSEQNLSYQRTENSVLKIRTQEGDVVALRIRVGESIKLATDSDVDSGTEVAETSLSTKSSTKVSLRVKGELNDDEMAAIQAVFVQSAALADAFFAGDYAAAFASASALEVDAHQLAKASLRLRVGESLTYSGSGLQPILLGAPSDAQAAPIESSAPVVPAAGAQTSEPETVAAKPEVSVPAPDTAESSTAIEPEAAFPAPTSASAFWFAAVIDFVGKLIETFDGPADAGDSEAVDSVESSASDPSRKVELNLSLKLRIFSSMLVEIGNGAVSTSESSTESLPALVPATIEALASEQDPGLDAVA